MKLTKENMPETMYRASRCCRALGNPTAYLILRLLDTRRMTPSEMSQALHVSLPTISVTLRHLRNLDLVRYETRGITKEYWVKDAKVLTVLSTLEALVGTMREKRA